MSPSSSYLLARIVLPAVVLLAAVTITIQAVALQRVTSENREMATHLSEVRQNYAAILRSSDLIRLQRDQYAVELRAAQTSSDLYRSMAGAAGRPTLRADRVTGPTRLTPVVPPATTAPQKP